MKALSRMLMMFAAISAIALTSCSKDDDEVDMTTQVVGDYNGDYKEGESGSSITIEDVDVKITKVSGSEIKVKIIVIPVLAETEFNATMDSETTFTVPDFELPDGPINGTGSLQNDNTLNLDLSAVNSANEITYTGERQ